MLVQHGFDAQCILGEEQGMDVKEERDRRIAKFAHSFHGVEAASHTKFDYPYIECTEVEDYIDMPSASVKRVVLCIGELRFCLVELLPDTPDTFEVSRGLELDKNICVVVDFVFLLGL
jgi:hypothetical protein